MALEVRSEVLEYGSLPMAPWLAQIESLQQIRAVILQLLQSSSRDEQGRSFVSPQVIAAALDTNEMQNKVLVDLLAALVEPPDLVQVPKGGEEPSAVEVYSLGLYLVAQFYLREAHKADTADSWPSDLFSMQQEPSSPMHMTAKSWGREQSPAHRAHLPMMRQHLQEHLALQEALLQGFSGFITRHAHALVALVLDPHATQQQQQQPGSPPQQQQQQQQQQRAAPPPPDGSQRVSAAELDRLSFLLRLSQGDGEEGGTARRLEGGSPMDVCCTPFTETRVRLSEQSPFFAEAAGASDLPTVDAVAAWITESLRQQGDSDMSDMAMGGSPRGPSPGSTSVFNQLVSVSGLALPTDIQGVSKATVVRGEGDFPSSTLRVLNCHDAVVYALAPLQYCLISACSDCVVVVGAVGRALRVERCERVQVIAAARSVAINTCHDCILYLGVNTRPAILGDNRFLQLAPYNAGYERLAEHMGLAGVQPQPNLWDWPISLQPDHRKHHHAPLHEVGAAGSAASLSPAAHHPHALGSPVQQQQQQAAAEAQPGPSPMVVVGGGEGSAAAEASAAVEAAMKAAGSESEGGEAAVPSPVLGTPASVTLLPPVKLLPFLIPFVGGSGPMCGGPAKVSVSIRASSAASPSSSSSSSHDSLSGFMALGEGSSTFPASPFGLPLAYMQAWEGKMRSAAEVRAAVKTAGLDEAKKRELMAAIQSHFKDWLQATGGMRQVYDLARMERDENSSQMMTSL